MVSLVTKAQLATRYIVTGPDTLDKLPVGHTALF